MQAPHVPNVSNNSPTHTNAAGAYHRTYVPIYKNVPYHLLKVLLGMSGCYFFLNDYISLLEVIETYAYKRYMHFCEPGDGQ